MENNNTTIQTERLDLVPMTPAFLEASLAGDGCAAEALLGLTIPPDWLVQTALMQVRRDDLRADPVLQPWLLRAVGLRHQRTMIGHIGFHSRPGPTYLQELAPGGVELGYTIFAPYRRQGYAYEACAALMEWAHREHGVTRFVVSISPDNAPSLGLARKLGFRRVGAHVDQEDGPEDIFLREFANYRAQH